MMQTEFTAVTEETEEFTEETADCSLLICLSD